MQVVKRVRGQGEGGEEIGASRGCVIAMISLWEIVNM